MTTTTMIIFVITFCIFELFVNPITREKAREREDARRREKNNKN